MKISLRNVSTESLVSELNRRFYEEAVNKTHAMLSSFRSGNFLGAFTSKAASVSGGKTRRKRKKMSKAARAKIAAAQKARWAKQKASNK
jgi:hypothetical protein